MRVSSGGEERHVLRWHAEAPSRQVPSGPGPVAPPTRPPAVLAVTRPSLACAMATSASSSSAVSSAQVRVDDDQLRHARGRVRSAQARAHRRVGAGRRGRARTRARPRRPPRNASRNCVSRCSSDVRGGRPERFRRRTPARKLSARSERAPFAAAREPGLRAGCPATRARCRRASSAAASARRCRRS